MSEPERIADTAMDVIASWSVDTWLLIAQSCANEAANYEEDVDLLLFDKVDTDDVAEYRAKARQLEELAEEIRNDILW
jgi:hypothetical protein